METLGATIALAISPFALFTDTQFRTTYLGTTKMWCHPQEVMDQENAFIKLMANRTFFYKVVDISPSDQALLLYETDVRESKGGLMARFIRIFE